MKTVISEMSEMIETGCKALTFFKSNKLIFEAEEEIYQNLIFKTKCELKIELEKAKKLLNDNDRPTN